ncbi:hypothetical protein SeLEV6574_g00388 [Synchytrium endobioticum]|uniref:Guanylate cyclase domain-containing protein n=1 Tax=Synchytrium endobioticum TaxID=286115 RepID=A0A507DI56_9FUNG|nr:hypothetical protein SeLEV6574_g00388 [Synchytrium endobioticum]
MIEGRGTRTRARRVNTPTESPFQQQYTRYDEHTMTPPYTSQQSSARSHLPSTLLPWMAPPSNTVGGVRNDTANIMYSLPSPFVAPLVSYDQVVPNFMSKHLRTHCDRLVERGVIPPQYGDDAARIAQHAPLHDRWNMNRYSASSASPAVCAEMQPSANEAFAAVVMADVSGYSKLTSVLAERGPTGAELLSKAMKGYLDKIIKIVLTNGGDIVKFAGDAVIFYWRMELQTSEETSKSPELDRRKGELIYKAALCCSMLLENLGSYNVSIPDCDTKKLMIHLGIGGGAVYDVCVGGPPGRWEHFIAGDAVTQLATVLDAAKPGQLAISHTSLRYLAEVVETRSIGVEGYDKRCITVRSMATAQRKVPPPRPVEGEDIDLWDITAKHANMALYEQFISHPALFKLQSDLTQSKVFRIQSHLSDLMSLHELRQVTTVFIKLGGKFASFSDPVQALDDAQLAMTVVQEAMKKYEGSLRQFHVDDKGAVILCFFGLPPLAHENDAPYGVKAALFIQESFRGKFKFSIGVTTGVVSIGGVGSAVRTEYAVMGDSINMAARLMCLPTAAASVICDERTFALAEQDIFFEHLGVASVKGKANLIWTFRPILARPDGGNGSPFRQTPREICGRVLEKTAIIDAISNHVAGEPPGVVVLESDAGQGLSTLVKYTRLEAMERGCHVCVGNAAEMEKYTPYYVFRDVLCDLLAMIESSVRNGKDGLKIPFVSHKPSFAIPSDSVSAQFATSRDGDNPHFRNIVQRKIDRKSIFEDDAVHPFYHRPKQSEMKHGYLNIIASNDSLVNAIKADLAPSNSCIDDDDTDSDDASEGTGAEVASASNIRTLEGHLGPVKRTAQVKFCNRVKSCLQKVGENPDLAPLLDEILPANFGQSEFVSSLSPKMRAKELAEMLRRMVNVLTETNPVVFTFHEVQWMDCLSWELVWEILHNCPRALVMIFSRVEKYYENDDGKIHLGRLRKAPRAVYIEMGGLSQLDTEKMIASTWSGNPCKAISSAITDSVYKRTNGNPLYIRSLTAALKDSGLWRISDDGTLRTEQGDADFEKLVLGFDLQSIITAQFDRLERNFQLFLKVASVLGQRFLLDDVLVFLSDLTGFADRFSKKEPGKIAKTVDAMDKYGFLTRPEGDQESLFFQFKSAVIHRSIYGMMVLSQRQQLHLNIAQYYEQIINDDNRHRLLIPLYEHFAETDDRQRLEKLKYLEAVCRFYYRKHSTADAIKHYNLLLVQANALERDRNMRVYEPCIRATWLRELGESYFARQEFEKAGEALVKSLTVLGHSTVSGGLGLALKVERAKRKRSKLEKAEAKAKFRSAQSVIIESKSTNRVGPMALDENAQFDRGESVTQLSALLMGPKWNSAYEVRRTYMLLARLYLQTGDTEKHCSAVFAGLNLSEGPFPRDSLHTNFVAMAGLLYWTRDGDMKTARLFMNHALNQDVAISDLSARSMVMWCGARFSYLTGDYAAALRQADQLLSLGHSLGDWFLREEALRLKALVTYEEGPRSMAMAASQEFYMTAVQENRPLGILWGCLNMLKCLLAGQSTGEEMADLCRLCRQEIAPPVPAWASHPALGVVKASILAECDRRLGMDVAIEPFLMEIHKHAKQLKQSHWYVVVGLHQFSTFMYAAYENGAFGSSSPQARRLATTLLADLCRALKPMSKACLSVEPLRYILKGLRSMILNRPAEAMRKWVRALRSEGAREQAYVVATIYWHLARYAPVLDAAAQERYLEKARLGFKKVAAAYELSQLAVVAKRVATAKPPTV